MWESWNVEVERVIDAGGEDVVALFREIGRTTSGLDLDGRHAELFRIRDGRIVRRQDFADANEALKAVGLER
jgi:ketosteroid isomerase-like protein